MTRGYLERHEKLMSKDIAEGVSVERKTAHDFDQELLVLFDAYVHGDIDRRTFLDRAGKFAVGGVTAAMLLHQLSPKFAEAQVVKADDARIAITRVEYDSPKGSGKMQGYLVVPAGREKKLPGVLVIHENRGLNPHIEDIARRMALEGFVAFAPDALFPLGGYPGDEDKARALFQKLDAAKTRQDMIAAVDVLKKCPECTGKVGAVGFCWGGGMVNFLATQPVGLSAGVPFYGSAPTTADVPKITMPLLIQSAEVDERINASWPEFEKALKAAKVPYERHLYPGTQHGFNNDTTPRHDAEAARLAWERTVAFFNRNLGSSGEKPR
jgi:carboxymethylenebutenolidase